MSATLPPSLAAPAQPAAPPAQPAAPPAQPVGPPAQPAARIVHVLAGIVRNAAGEVLIAERPAGKHHAGGWEFPGGKLETDETRLAALTRELREEIGVEVEAARPLLAVRHAYPDRTILLDVWTVTRHRGSPHGAEGQTLRWCPVGELADAGLLPADRPIATALRLPERLVAADTADYVVRAWRAVRDAAKLRSGADDLHAARDAHPALQGVSCGDADAALRAAAAADFIVLTRALPPGALAALCRRVAVPVFAYGISLEEASANGAVGVSGIGP